MKRPCSNGCGGFSTATRGVPVCDACHQETLRRLSRASSRLYRERHKITSASMDATCWCERKAVSVTPDDVRKGMTGSCGHAECHPPALTGAHPGG